MAKHEMHDGLPPLLNVDNLADGAVYELMGEAFSELANQSDFYVACGEPKEETAPHPYSSLVEPSLAISDEEPPEVVEKPKEPVASYAFYVGGVR